MVKSFELMGNTKWMLGNGIRIKFWADVPLIDEVLIDEVPLIMIAKSPLTPENRNRKVAKYSEQDRGWDWKLLNHYYR